MFKILKPTDDTCRQFFELAAKERNEFPADLQLIIDEKMKAVDKKLHIIPPELDSQKSKIYSVLSKGIHEYEEDECYELYPAMRTIIILMLENYLSDKESKQQLKGIEKTLKSK